MRFLVDQNLPPRLCVFLRNAGHDAVHTSELGLATAEDWEVMGHARDDGRVIISSDTDFGTLLATQHSTAPSVILTRRIATMSAPELAGLLLANLDSVADVLEAGAVVAFTVREIRIRRLPLL